MKCANGHDMTKRIELSLATDWKYRKGRRFKYCTECGISLPKQIDLETGQAIGVS